MKFWCTRRNELPLAIVTIKGVCFKSSDNIELVTGYPPPFPELDPRQ